ncbi:hypothetical protein AJ80_05735 [Polytolypa hystricis UAMH7299]|uniref:Transcription initiation factor TFIID subunit 8 n=1 Tax=Polytolypa hystricis (strain UAMH7299) TaxID=1447883 RepID=A0A2B7Y286_POLH7|nr:hypothetical protein AJ80_05735 [Polytolypa hystricis UAMH7299]
MPPLTTPAASSPLKRPSPPPAHDQLKQHQHPEPEEHSPKRQRRRYHHHHSLKSPVLTGLVDPALSHDPDADTLLKLSIGQALNDEGFTHADPLALESFRNHIEDEIINFLSFIRQSMNSCRRIQPIPQDFEHALRCRGISTDSLRPHLTSRRSPIHLLPTPPPEEPEPTSHLPFLGPELIAHDTTSYIPKHFPSFPSKHTYQETPVFTRRQLDPRKVREQATEEGRLGEEALRKLARAAKTSHPSFNEQRDKKLWARRNENMESMFEKALTAFSKKAALAAAAEKKDNTANVDTAAGDLIFQDAIGRKATVADSGAAVSLLKSPSKIDLGPIVNCDRTYWRKPAAAEVRNAERKSADVKDAAVIKVEH